MTRSPRDSIWVVEHQGQVAGSIAIVEVKKKLAQLRWFLLHPRLRGQGIGKQLLQDAISFSRQSGYGQIELWTTRNLTTASHLYRSAGFELTREITHPLWGQIVAEQRYDLRL
jgi:N-acetylglutamate synthase-like GNAT family acetyltransferase